MTSDLENPAMPTHMVNICAKITPLNYRDTAYRETSDDGQWTAERPENMLPSPPTVDGECIKIREG